MQEKKNQLFSERSHLISPNEHKKKSMFLFVFCLPLPLVYIYFHQTSDHIFYCEMHNTNRDDIKLDSSIMV